MPKLFPLMDSFQDPDMTRHLLKTIHACAHRPIRLMEVCGTHTVSIFRSGIRSLLPPQIELLSGPGCPVCVTPQHEIDWFIALAQQKQVILTTFGDLMRVPGSHASLQMQKAAGKDVRIVYSVIDALEIARKHPSQTVVFPAIGFETTAPTIAAAIQMADGEQIDNFAIYCAHKTVPPALEALLAHPEVNIDGLLLPGHVSAIIGLDGYRPFFDRHRLPAVIAGFESVDLLDAIARLCRQVANQAPQLENAYTRVVQTGGNPRARAAMDLVFKPVDSQWRGLGIIPNSGLTLRSAYAAFDATQRFSPQLPEPRIPTGCICDRILTGVKQPPQCALYGKTCTPQHPVGPCMVSSEGACAAYYRYH